MRECLHCGRDFAEVIGAPDQVCPHCGVAVEEPLAAAAPIVRADPAGAAGWGFREWPTRWGAIMWAWGPAVLITLASNLLLVGYAASTGFPLEAVRTFTTDINQLPVTDSLRFLGVALPLALLSASAHMASWVLIARLAVEHAGREPAPIEWKPLVALGVGLTLLYLAGLLLFIVPFLILFHWYAYAPAVVAERGGGVRSALEASRTFAKERRTHGYAAMLLLVWLVVFVMASILAALVRLALTQMGLSEGLAVEIAGPLGSWPFAPLIPWLAASMWLHGQAPPPPPPKPNARPSERFRTSKCPSCGTLVPYSSTGSPVEVECPVCGTKGRVL